MVRAKLWAVIRREFLERAQNRWFIAGSLLGPVFIAGILFLPAYLSLRNARPDSSSLIVIDATGTGLDGTAARIGVVVDGNPSCDVEHDRRAGDDA